MNKAPRHTFKPSDVLLSADAVHPSLSGSGMHDLGKLLAPKREAIRGMLLEMRTRLRWSQQFAAAVLGVPLTTVRKWENGSRNPSGAAKKFIWLLHGSLLDGPRKAFNAWDLAVWGTVDCRVSSTQPLGVSATVTIPKQEIQRQVEAWITEEERQHGASAGVERS